MLYCGLRPSETAALTRNKINIEKEEIEVSSAVASGTKKIKNTKTKSGTRIVPIPKILLPKLEAEIKQKPLGYLFLTNKGTVLTGDRLCAWWNSIKREMDILMGAKVYRNQIINSVIAPGLTAYCLRHTYCTDLEKAGVSLTTARDLMGHSDIAVTANIYTHSTDISRSAAREAINKMHKPKNEPVPKPVPK